MHDAVWMRIENVYGKSMKTYLKTFAVRKINKEKLYQSERLALSK
jgi:hypothetical protein